MAHAVDREMDSAIGKSTNRTWRLRLAVLMLTTCIYVASYGVLRSRGSLVGYVGFSISREDGLREHFSVFPSIEDLYNDWSWWTMHAFTPMSWIEEKMWRAWNVPKDNYPSWLPLEYSESAISE